MHYIALSLVLAVWHSNTGGRSTHERTDTTPTTALHLFCMWHVLGRVWGGVGWREWPPSAFSDGDPKLKQCDMKWMMALDVGGWSLEVRCTLLITHTPGIHRGQLQITSKPNWHVWEEARAPGGNPQPGPSYWEATVFTTTPPCDPIGLKIFINLDANQDVKPSLWGK